MEYRSYEAIPFLYEKVRTYFVGAVY